MDHVKIRNANPIMCIPVRSLTHICDLINRKMAYIVYPIMCIPSCVYHHVYPIMCIPSCVSHHVCTFTCITFARHIICALIPHDGINYVGTPGGLHSLSHHVYTIMCIPSCVYHHVYTIMCTYTIMCIPSCV